MYTDKKQTENFLNQLIINSEFLLRNTKRYSSKLTT